VPVPERIDIENSGLTDGQVKEMPLIVQAFESVAKAVQTRVISIPVHNDPKLQDAVYQGLSQLKASSLLMLDTLFDDDHYRTVIQRESIRSMARHNPSLALLYLEQLKSLEVLGLFHSPKAESIKEELQTVPETTAIVIPSGKDEDLTYHESNGQYLISGQARTILGGNRADVFIVEAKDRNGQNPKFFIVEKSDKISTTALAKPLGLESIGFADIAFHRNPAIDNVPSQEAFDALRKLEGLGIAGFGIGLSEGLIEETEKHSFGRKQGPKGSQVPNLYYAPVHRMIETIADNGRRIADLDPNDPKQLRKMIHLISQNGTIAVQVLGGAGLDMDSRYVNGSWRASVSLLGLQTDSINRQEQDYAVIANTNGGIDLGLNLNIKQSGLPLNMGGSLDTARFSSTEGYYPQLISEKSIRDFASYLS